MEQHAIPQQISNYEFKLVGDMTLKQFLKAAVGIVLAFLINASGLIFFIKWPLMLICGGGGLMLAFVPFQDRPLETWIAAFLKSIYSPTIYTYKKIPDKDWMDLIMSKGKKAKDKNDEEEEPETPVKDRDRVKEFIESLPSVKLDKNKEELNPPAPTSVGAPSLNKEGRTEEAVVKGVDVEDKKAENWRDKKANLNLKTEKLGATGTAVFGEIPMPDKSDIPNMVVGMVTNMEGKIIEGVIVEIQDEKGNPSRVLKTNSLGQFKTTTPLADGKYLVITEKENYNFDRVNINLTGKIVEPIKIKAIV
jgi:hypothetical protein